MAGSRPLVISLHGSDVFVAERHMAIGAAARAAFRRCGWVTACSDDLRDRAIALGASAERSETVPYGVDTGRFRPDAGVRARRRAQLGIADGQPLLVAVGRLVRKKGFEYLVDAMPRVRRRRPDVRVIIAGSGDLDAELRARAVDRGIADCVAFPGVLNQDEVGELLAAADVVVVPSVRDDSGNVDGLPNVVMETLASGAALVATRAGGIASVARDHENALLVAERDPEALAQAIDQLLSDVALRERIARTARRDATAQHSWAEVARRFERAYVRAGTHALHRAPPVAN
jgi:glycosyltransferase involved in cell wall biosynthesis